MQVLMVACDPGMIIRQESYPSKGSSGGFAPAEQVIVSVKTVNQLIGETWYDPKITVTNNSESPIIVTGIELFVQGKTYARDSTRTGASPLIIQSGSVRSLEVSFRLDADVKKMFFRHPAELLVHYQIGVDQKTARTRIVGANLDGSR